MDDCYGKQIDFYNQMPNSVQVLDDLVKRLEESERKTKELIDFSFRLSTNFTVRGEITWTESSRSTDPRLAWWYGSSKLLSSKNEKVEFNVVFEKDKGQVRLEIRKFFEYVFTYPDDQDEDNEDDYELRLRVSSDPESTIVDTDLEEFDTDAVIDIHGEFNVYKKRQTSTEPEYYYLEFSNGGVNVRKEITYIRFERSNPLLDFLRYKKGGYGTLPLGGIRERRAEGPHIRFERNIPLLDFIR